MSTLSLFDVGTQDARDRAIAKRADTSGPSVSSPSGVPSDVWPKPARFSVHLVREEFDADPYANGYKVVGIPTEVAELVRPFFEHEPCEKMMAVYRATDGRVIGVFELSRGTLDSTVASPRDCFRPALLCNAASVVLVHNHPSGNPEPSRPDVRVTKQFAEAGKMLGIDLLDHLILTFQGDRMGFTSLSERGLM